MKFKHIIFNISILIFMSCGGIKQTSFVGTYHETAYGPMSEVYIFKADNTFEHYYADDTYGKFGRGKYKIKGNRLVLNYDVLPIDSLIILETINKPSDSLKLEMIIMSVSNTNEIRIYEKDSLIYESFLFDDTISVALKRPVSKINIKAGNYNSRIKNETKLISELIVENYSYCKFEYFPSRSWYKFNTEKDENIKLRNFKEGYFEIKRGKYRWRFQRG